MASASRLLTCALCLLPGALPGAQQPTFRAGVDVVAVDVQVIGGDGRPLSSLKKGDFDVWLDGRPRRVVSVDLIRYAERRAPREAAPTRRPQSRRAVACETRVARLFWRWMNRVLTSRRGSDIVRPP